MQQYQSSTKGSSSSNVSAISRKFPLETNAHSVYYVKIINVHKYLLTTKISSDNASPVSQDILQRNQVNRIMRRYIMEMIVPQFDQTDQVGVVLGWAMEALYSTKPMRLSNSSQGDDENQFVFKREKVQLTGTNIISVDIHIRLVKTFESNSPEYRFDLMSSIVHHQLFIDMIKYGSVYFKKPSSEIDMNRRHLISQKCLGMSISSVKHCENSLNIININSPVAYLTNNFKLIDIVASVVYDKVVHGLYVHSLPQDHDQSYLDQRLVNYTLTHDQYETLKRHLDGYKCHAFINRDPIVLRCNLTHKIACQEFIMSQGCNMPLMDYYRKSGIELTYPRLPCLQSQRGELIPIELCVLYPGQKTPIFRLGRHATLDLVKYLKQKPHDSKILSDQAKNEICAINGRKFEEFGIALSRENVSTQGSAIGKPILQFKDKFMKPVKDYWESSQFFEPMNLNDDWCVVNALSADNEIEYNKFNRTYEHDKHIFFDKFSLYCQRFGFNIAPKPCYYSKSVGELGDFSQQICSIMKDCQARTNGNLKLLIFVIGPSVTKATKLNRLIHLSFDDNPNLAVTCIRFESIINYKQYNAIFRTLVHKLNARLGGVNVTYNPQTLTELDLTPGDLLVIGLDVTHPDNELKGVSIVGCAYSFSDDLFKHKSLVWPQTARIEIIGKMDVLMTSILSDYATHNQGKLPKHIIVYRDGVSHEEFFKVETHEVSKAQMIIKQQAERISQNIPKLSYIIAQKRHTMRFYQAINMQQYYKQQYSRYDNQKQYTNPPSGTLIEEDVITRKGSEFYLYSNISNHATARPIHYHVIKDGLGIGRLQKLTYYMSFNYGKCSGTLSMPSSLRYAHNAAYDARNRVLEAREFSDTKFYTSKFFC